jgi:hypothetical protein
MRTIITILLLMLSGHLLSQSGKPKTMNKTAKPAKATKPAYLDKTDSVFLAIKERVIRDLQTASKKADPNTPENLAKAEEMKTWSEEKREKYYEDFYKSLRDYLKLVRFDFDIFMLLFRDFATYDQKAFEAYDFRVRNVAPGKYAAEFWEDGLIANSEANAIKWAEQLMVRNPEDKTIMATVKETYANARKAIRDGKQERYTEIIALLYTKEKNGTIVFHDPGDALAGIK